MARQLGPGAIRKVARKDFEVWELNYRARDKRSVRKVLLNPNGLACRTKTEAQRAQARIIHERDCEDGLDRSCLDWRLAMEQYLQELASRTKEAHVANFRRSIELVLSETCAEFVGDIKLAAILTWRDDRKKVVSPSTCNHDTVAIRSFTKWLMKRDLLSEDPLRGLEELKVKQVRPMRAFTEDELGQFFQAAKELDQTRLEERQAILPIRWVFRALAETGVRYGELRQVRWEDLDLGDNPFAAVRASTSKGAKARRVPITEAFRDAIVSMKSEQASLLGRVPKQSGPVWLTGRGKALYKQSSALLRSFDAVLELACIAKTNDDGESLVIHSFRHTMCTRLLRAEVAPQHVMQILGHRTQDMVMRVYNHMNSNDTRAAVQKLPQIPVTSRVQEEGRPFHKLGSE